MRVPLEERDLRRHFGKSQRKELFEKANGRCEDCQDVLRPGWQADHIKPWSHGGRTTLENGRALCPYCNLARSDKHLDGVEEARPSIQPRGWQQDMLDAWRASQNTTFVANVAPGGGKTLGAAFLARKESKFVVVVVPSLIILSGFIEEFASLGIQLEPFSGTGVRHGFDGVAVTYQAIGRANTTNALIAAIKAQNRGLFLVADEIHHAGEGKSWGVSLGQLCDVADKILLMSGTPFREDGRTIPGVDYDSGNRASFDYVYPYADALKDGHIVPVRFPLQGGEAIWELDLEEHLASTSGWDELPAGHQNKLLTRLFSPKSNYMQEVLMSANEELEFVRQTRLPQAGGIVFCYQQEDARATANLLTKLTGHNAEVIVSDDNTSQERLAIFARGGTEAPRWLVTCKMVSEGANVKRLRVGVWATNIRRSRLFFLQLVGRIQRAVRGVRNDYASLYLPDITELRDLALAMREEQAVVGFDVAETKVRVEHARSAKRKPRAIPTFLGDASWAEGEVLIGEKLSAEERTSLSEATRNLARTPTLNDRLSAVQALRSRVGPKASDRADDLARRLASEQKAELTPVQYADLLERLLTQIAEGH